MQLARAPQSGAWRRHKKSVLVSAGMGRSALALGGGGAVLDSAAGTWKGGKDDNGFGALE